VADGVNVCLSGEIIKITHRMLGACQCCRRTFLAIQQASVKTAIIDTEFLVDWTSITQSPGWTSVSAGSHRPKSSLIGRSISSCLTVKDAHVRRNCRDLNGEQPWGCCDCDCTKKTPSKPRWKGRPFLDRIQCQRPVTVMASNPRLGRSLALPGPSTVDEQANHVMDRSECHLRSRCLRAHLVN
jgi:hypothetical protein